MDQTTTAPIAITEKEFEQKVLEADQPVLVDFWAEWCAPCRALGPIFDSLAAEFGDRATVAKVDVDSNQSIAMRYGIRSIPTVMLFDKGEVVETFIGVKPKADYASALEKVA
jgi:thioredoxin 1